MLQARIYFFFLLFFSITIEARAYMSSRVDFLLLSKEEKKEMVIKFMELVAEIEKNYPHDKTVTLQELEQFKDYQRLFTKLQLLMMNHAHAQDKNDSDKIWKDYADGFTKLKDESNVKNKCLYAGWISTMHVSEKYCLHPAFSSSKDVKKIYGDINDCGKDRKMIKCNPAVFGFKSIKDQSLFCVDSTKWSHNSSVACMNEALSDTPGSGVDKKEDRINYLVAQLEKEGNEGIYNEIQEFIYKFCVCSDKIPTNFNEYYRKYMKPHRTCYGLMKMIGETSNACKNETKTLDTTFFDKLTAFQFEKDLKNPHKKNNISDKLYGDFLAKFTGDNPEIITKMCIDETVGPKVTPTDKTDEEVDNKKVEETTDPTLEVRISDTFADYCTVLAEPKNHQGWTFDWIPHEQIKTDKKTNLNGLDSDDGNQADQSTNDLTTNVPRQAQTFEVCGKLTKAGQSDIRACVTIPSKQIAPLQQLPPITPAPVGSGSSYPMGPGPMVVPPMDTATQGIN